MKIRLGTRASALARAQTALMVRQITDAALARGVDVTIETVPVTTEGDTYTGPLSQAGGVGLFVAALRVALLRQDCDAVVHSLKDVPTGGHEDLALAAVPQRADARDCLVSDGRPLADLPHGAIVATGSPRRAAQLRALRPDIAVAEVRGNVDTRIQKARDGQYDAVVLAMAGLQRLGRADEATEVFGAEQMVPAPGQGALAIECRADADAGLVELLSSLDHLPTRAAVTAERAALAAVEAGCNAPLGAHATVEGEWLSLHVRAINQAGTLALNEHQRVPLPQAEVAGRSAGLSLLGRGAGRLMELA